MRIYWVFISLFLTGINLNAQELDTVYLENPSFEGVPSCCRLPYGWYNCGDKKETPPDTHPGLDKDGNPFFGVTKEAYDGKTYIGMVVRENNTHECISQRLEEALLVNHCYSFTIYLCRSKFYIGAKDTIEKPFQYINANEPVIFRMWGNGKWKNETQLLAASEPILNLDWMKYDCQFKARYNIYNIRMEAYFNSAKLFPYNGNILLDNASDFYEIDCDSLKLKEN